MISAFEKEAQGEGTTLNATVSSLIAQHLEWGSKAKKFGFIPVYGPLFLKILDELDDETLIHIGRTVLPTMWKEMALFWYQDSSAEKVLDFLSMRSSHLPYVQTEVRKQGNSYTMVFRHDLGPRWSVVLHGALDELVRQTFRVQPKVDVGDTVVTVDFSLTQANSPT